MAITRSIIVSTIVSLSLALTAATTRAADQTVRIFAMDSNTKDAAIGCESDSTCLPWQVYKMKIVNGPEKGRIIYAAERSAKKKPRWKFKNKEIQISEIDNTELAERLNAEYTIQ